jgi:hypothetical protein
MERPVKSLIFRALGAQRVAEYPHRTEAPEILLKTVAGFVKLDAFPVDIFTQMSIGSGSGAYSFGTGREGAAGTIADRIGLK